MYTISLYLSNYCNLVFS